MTCSEEAEIARLAFACCRVYPTTLLPSGLPSLPYSGFLYSAHMLTEGLKFTIFNHMPYPKESQMSISASTYCLFSMPRPLLAVLYQTLLRTRLGLLMYLSQLPCSQEFWHLDGSV